MKIKYEMLTDQGLKRKNNQDRICAYLSDDAALFAVADGMGAVSYTHLTLPTICSV